jgi:hypothetical protein
MLNQNIFRKTPLERMTTPEDLDELLRVNSTRTWLLFAALAAVLAGLLMWGFLGTITREVKGAGLILYGDLPREVVAYHSGQVDSVFVRSGENVAGDQKLMSLYRPEEHTTAAIHAPFEGEVTNVNVKEGDWIKTGDAVLEMIKSVKNRDANPEVIFFVNARDISKIRPGMTANIETERAVLPAGISVATVTFAGEYPVAENAVYKYLAAHEHLNGVDSEELYEVRAKLNINPSALPESQKALLASLNGLACRVHITVARHSPFAFLLK